MEAKCPEKGHQSKSPKAHKTPCPLCKEKDTERGTVCSPQGGEEAPLHKPGTEEAQDPQRLPEETSTSKGGAMVVLKVPG